MFRYFSLLLALFPIEIFALPSTGVNPVGGLFSGKDWSLIELISYGEKILIQVVLPLSVVGVALYIGYHLLTAE